MTDLEGLIRGEIAKVLHEEEQIYHSIDKWDKLTGSEKDSFLKPADRILSLITPLLEKAREEERERMLHKIRNLFWFDEDSRTAGLLVTGSVIYSEFAHPER